VSIEIHSIRKTFGRFRALEDVSFAVRTGELVALLGPSGSGKTTLLRIMAGLETPDPRGGRVLFEGADVTRKSVGERGIGFVFQHYALFRHLRVFDNVAFGLKVRSRRLRPNREDIRRKVGDLLRLVHLEGLADRYPHQLSGGQRQRVALARALAVEPRVLLLDEPFGALDAKVRQDLRRWLRRLHDDIHVTSVFVTHDQDEALELADRVVVMNAGRVEQIGTPDDVFHRPRTEFVMSFLGNVNRFHGRVQDGSLSFASVEVPSPDAARLPSGEARVFVRPHEFDIDVRKGGSSSLKATVVRVHSAGPVVRIDLKSESGDHVEIDVPQERFRSLALAPGQAVFVTPRGMRVFGDGPAAC
jgi:sulfate transport system ATP-binding protein